MSRSRRHLPCCSITVSGFNRGEKRDKQIANRQERRVVATALRGEPPEVLPLKRELSNIWAWRKDGKQYCHRPEVREEVMRK